tara:strand:+ start:1104 stop:2450 length:1347 start_codon:yes stop_codon:yes gene_type:complete
MADSNYFIGSNRLSAWDIFGARSLYQSYAYTPFDEPFNRLDPAETYPIRNFQVFENFYYGRVDPFLVAIEPNKDRMVSLSVGQSVLDFVADAFKAMKKDIKAAYTAGTLSTNNQEIASMTPTTTFVDVNTAYNIYLESIQAQFYWLLRDDMQQQPGKKIVSFETFEPLFTDFIKDFAQARTLTKSSFLLSSFWGSINNSALVVEIAGFDKSDDQKKLEFINSASFPFYVQLASKHGFYVDYNVPWRLVADISSPPMLEFRAARGDSGDLIDFFSQYYSYVYYDEMKIIKNLYFKTYSDLVIARPWFTTDVWSDGRRYSRKVYRVPISYSEFQRKYNPLLGDDPQDPEKRDNGYWLEKYLTIKNWEKGNLFTDPILKRLIRNSKNLDKRVDKLTALRYINSKFRESVATAEGSFNEYIYKKMYKQQEILPVEDFKEFLNELYRSKTGNF